MKGTLTTRILLVLTAFSGLSYASPQNYHPKHLFVKMKSGQNLLSSPLIKGSKRIVGDIYLVKTSELENLEIELSDHQQIEYVQKDFYGSFQKNSQKHEALDPIKQNIESNISSSTFFNDPMVDNLWAFNSKSGMNVEAAYSQLPPLTPEDIIVAVVDTGVDHRHEDLKDVMWVNEREIPGDKIDNDGNGYIDDVHGINTLKRDPNGRAIGNTLPSFQSEGFIHGTHVAGTIAASQNNGKGIAGVASHVKIMAIRTVPDESDELDSDIVESFKYAANHGAKIINCSFGKAVNERGRIVLDVMNEIAKSHEVLVVVAAGNSTQNIDIFRTYPASFNAANMLVVAASNLYNSLATFSNYGKVNVDVAAPGENIYSTLPGNMYGSLSGTSMAAPNVAGVAAMIKSYYPHLTAAQLKEVIMKSVTLVPSYKARMVTGGRVNLKAAMQKASEIH